MISKTMLSLGLLIVIVTGSSNDVLGAIGDITVDVGSGQCTLGPSPSPLNFSNPFTCGNITITPKSAGSARVEIQPTDGSSDILRLTNAVITATQAVNNFHIIFSRLHTPGPNTLAGSGFGKDVFYKIWAYAIMQGAGAAMTVTTSVQKLDAAGQPIPGEPLVPMGSLSWTAAQGSNLDTSATVQWPEPPANPHLSGNRRLLVDLSITLPQNGTLDFGNWLRFASQLSSDEPPPDGQKCLGLFTQCTTESTQRGFMTAALTEDGVLKKTAKVTIFAKSVWASLSHDMAQGRGEHLTSLATLLHVPTDEQSAFFSLAQDQYADLAHHGRATPERMLVALHESMAVHPTLSKLSSQPVH